MQQWHAPPVNIKHIIPQPQCTEYFLHVFNFIHEIIELYKIHKY